MQTSCTIICDPEGFRKRTALEVLTRSAAAIRQVLVHLKVITSGWQKINRMAVHLPSKF